MASMPRLKPIGGIKAPKEGQGAGIPHMPTGAMDKPHPPLQLNKGAITGFARGGMVQGRPMKPVASPADLIRQRAQAAQKAQPQGQPAPMPIPMRKGGMVPGYAMGGMPIPMQAPVRKPTMPRKQTPMLPGPGGSKAPPMGLMKGGLVGGMAVPPGEKANKKVKRMSTKKKASKKAPAKKGKK